MLCIVSIVQVTCHSLFIHSLIHLLVIVMSLIMRFTGALPSLYIRYSALTPLRVGVLPK